MPVVIPGKILHLPVAKKKKTGSTYAVDSEKIWYQQIRFDSRDAHLENLVVTKCIVPLDLQLLVTRPVSEGPFWSLHESFIGLSEAISHNWHHRGARGAAATGLCLMMGRAPGGLGGHPGPQLHPRSTPGAPRGPSSHTEHPGVPPSTLSTPGSLHPR